MKRVFVQRSNLEVMVNAFIKAEGISKEQAINEVETILKETGAEVIILDEFTTRNADLKK